MYRLGFEPTIPVFEQAKTVHTLDCAATVIDACMLHALHTSSFLIDRFKTFGKPHYEVFSTLLLIVFS
jgi:hypothetical protein